MDDKLLSLITDICDRPGLYIGEPSVIRLYAFLNGYCFAVRQLTLDVPLPTILGAFRDWLANAYSVKESLGWDQILCLHAGNDRDGFYLFTHKWEEFLDNRDIDHH